jgi:hypothetical protein
MLEHIDIVFTLLALDVADISVHTTFLEAAGKGGSGKSVGVETTQSDELPDKAELTQLPNVGFHIIVSHTGSIPTSMKEC